MVCAHIGPDFAGWRAVLGRQCHAASLVNRPNQPDALIGSGPLAGAHGLLLALADTQAAKQGFYSLATAVWADRRAAGLRPADAGERGLRFLIRHPHDVPQREGLGGWGEEEVLGHVTASDGFVHRI